MGAQILFFGKADCQPPTSPDAKHGGAVPPLSLCLQRVLQGQLYLFLPFYRQQSTREDSAQGLLQQGVVATLFRQ
jgi:hypothetical protein